MIELFTQEELKPSEKTLNIIRQIAYTYRAIKVNGKLETYCLNLTNGNFSITIFIIG